MPSDASAAAWLADLQRVPSPDTEPVETSGAE
jgi:hypothetical protein